MRKMKKPFGAMIFLILDFADYMPADLKQEM